MTSAREDANAVVKDKLIASNIEWPLGPPVVTIGRSASCHVMVEAKGASRVHAVLRLDRQCRYVLFDWGSRNGTHLNGVLVGGPEVLKTGDKIKICDEVLEFCGNYESATPSQAKPGFKKPSGEPSQKACSVVLLAVKLRSGYESLFRDKHAIQAYALGQWIKAQEKAVKQFGGFFDHPEKGFHLSYWKLEKGKLSEVSAIAQECAKTCLEVAKIVGSEIVQRFAQTNEKPAFKGCAALHYGPVDLLEIGKISAQKLEGVEGENVTICEEICERAISGSCEILCSEEYQNSLGWSGSVAPYSMALMGPRKKSVVLFQIKG